MNFHTTALPQVLYTSVLDSMWLMAPAFVWTALLTTIYILSFQWTAKMEVELQVWKSGQAGAGVRLCVCGGGA